MSNSNIVLIIIIDRMIDELGLTEFFLDKINFLGFMFLIWGSSYFGKIVIFGYN